MSDSTVTRVGRLRLALFVAGTAALATWTVATAAEWTDSVTLTPTGPGGGDLVSTSFGIEQRAVAADGTTGAWTGGGAANPATTLPFDPAALDDGAVRYAGLEVRTRSGSLAGRVALTSPTTTIGADDATKGDGGATASDRLRDALHVRVARLRPGAGCSASSMRDGGVLVDGPLATAPASDPIALAGDSGDSVLLCFEVAPESGAQELPARATLDVTWRLEAVSTA